MILTTKQQELVQWYYLDRRTMSEIAELWRTSQAAVNHQLVTLRAVFASHGKELPRYNRGRPRVAPNLPETAVA
jgi:predicted DNA-binding protein YlxM (UPF0122 family)